MQSPSPTLGKAGGGEPGPHCCWQHGGARGDPLNILRSSIYKNTCIYGAIYIASRHGMSQQGMMAWPEPSCRCCCRHHAVNLLLQLGSNMPFPSQNLLFLSFYRKTLGLEFPFQPPQWLLGWCDSHFATGQPHRALHRLTPAQGCPSCCGDAPAHDPLKNTPIPKILRDTTPPPCTMWLCKGMFPAVPAQHHLLL